MTKKHIAGSGKRAGQWVICSAKKGCTLAGTVHLDSSVIEAVRQWKQGDESINLASITLTDVKQYVQQNPLVAVKDNFYVDETLEIVDDLKSRSEKSIIVREPIALDTVPSELYPYVEKQILEYNSLIEGGKIQESDFIAVGGEVFASLYGLSQDVIHKRPFGYTGPSLQFRPPKRERSQEEYRAYKLTVARATAIDNTEEGDIFQPSFLEGSFPSEFEAFNDEYKLLVENGINFKNKNKIIDKLHCYSQDIYRALPPGSYKNYNNEYSAFYRRAFSFSNNKEIMNNQKQDLGRAEESAIVKKNTLLSKINNLFK